MRRPITSDDTSFVCLDRASAAGQKNLAGAGYRLAAGGLGRRWTQAGEDGEGPCLEDEFVAHTARAWTRMRAAAAHLPEATRAGASAAAGQVERVPLATVCQATALCAMAAIGASSVLYWQKSRTARVDHEIIHVVGEMAQTQAQTGRLRAQWLALNDPARLQDAAARYSELRPMAPAQFVDAGTLADHLPAPGAVPADTGAETAQEAPVAGDAAPVFKPVSAQSVSMMVPASSAPNDVPPAPAPVAASPPAAPGQPAFTDSTPRETAGTQLAATEPATPPPAAEAQDRVREAMPDAPRAVAPHPHAVLVRQAFVARPPLHPAAPAVIHAASTALRVAPPAPHVETRPHVLPRMMMARFDMPHWLMETHAPRPVAIMSVPPHALAVPQSHPVSPPARHEGEAPLSVSSDDREAAAPQAEPQDEEVRRPAPIYRPPAYRPAYGYGYGYAPYGYPYQPAPPRYYPNPYGGYSSQPYGGYGAYYQ